jgi:lauroyl/myristoyl acyltransferase
MRRRVRIKTIYRDGAASKVLDSLKKGEIVVFLIDQYVLPFFHGSDPRWREIIPRFAKTSGAPVIPFYTLQGNDGRTILRVLPPIRDVSSSALEDMVMQVIKESPHRWFWWRRLGKTKRGHRELDAPAA